MQQRFAAPTISVSLQDMLAARERRLARRDAALALYRLPVLSATLVMPGPQKNTGLARFLMSEGARAIENMLRARSWRLRHHASLSENTGIEAIYVVDADAHALKRALVDLEDNHPLGRLWDFDLNSPDGGSISRALIGNGPRRCLVCAEPGHACSRSQRHCLAELMDTIGRTVDDYMDADLADGLRPAKQQAREWLGEDIACLAYQALLKEVPLTPKPGLVDLHNSGAHSDMNVFTFLTSAVVLRPWFNRFFDTGFTECDMPASVFLPHVRPVGLECERDMLTATRGVNTHKGSIFAFGLLCAAAGRLAGRGASLGADILCKEVAGMCVDLVDELDAAREARTAGKLFFQRYGMTGARGEAASGFATVRKHSLPAYQKLRRIGVADETALLVALLELLAFNPDTNLVARGGLEGLSFVQKLARALRSEDCAALPYLRSRLQEFDELVVARNLSPGGSADLLAVTWFLGNLGFGATVPSIP